MRFLLQTLVAITLFAACQNQEPKAPAAPDATAITNHKYWVSKPFYDALFAANISDTLGNLPCGELVFTQKDTLLFTSCLSDAGMGLFKATAPNTLQIVLEGMDAEPATATLDDKTGVLHLKPFEGKDYNWPSSFVAVDGISNANIDDVTLALGRKRLAGAYTMLPQKGEVAITSLIELRADGTQAGLGDYDKYEPWIAGIGSGAIQNPQRNIMYLVKKGKESEPDNVAWQLRGDTLRLWETKSINEEGDMPEYKVTKLKGTYVKTK